MLFFFFKQKTAYEMRISDWSSDVCSSDLLCHHVKECGAADADLSQDNRRIDRCGRYRRRSNGGPGRIGRVEHPPEGEARSGDNRGNRSEEHTSELQSLMRISYAVFCLKKKKQNNTADTATVKTHTKQKDHKNNQKKKHTQTRNDS